MSGIKAAFGAAALRDDSPYASTEALKELMDVLKSGGVKVIDTAQLYGTDVGGSEQWLGKADAGESFVIDTKAVGGFVEGSGTRENIIQGAKDSEQRLKSKVDIFYLHAPDSSVPLSETLAGINEVHKTGFFKRFGISNYKAEDVQKVYDHCKENGYVLPTVYQGNYSPVARRQETVLFPTLRKLGMSFYAYSPIAGGFLVKTKQQILDGAGRFAKDGMYAKLYSKPAYLDALEQWATIAKEAGCSKADLAYRWVKYNSPLSPDHGDCIIIGASKLEQLKETLHGVNAGPLREDILKKIDHVWSTIEHEAPLDNYNY